MSTMIALRKTARSPSVGIGARDISQTGSAWVNIDSPRVLRDLARHEALGQYIVTQGPRFQLDTAVVTGLVAAPRTASLVLDVSVGGLTYNQSDATYTKNVNATVAATTATVVPNATNPLVAAIGLNTSTPASPTAVVLAGTAAATTLESRALGNYLSVATPPATDSTADRTWLALVWVPPQFASVTGVAATGVFTVGSSHGYVVGDPVWFGAVTGATAGITASTLYYVNTVPSATTFTVSATLGGPTLTWTTNITAATPTRQILAKDVIDTRP